MTAAPGGGLLRIAGILVMLFAFALTGCLKKEPRSEEAIFQIACKVADHKWLELEGEVKYPDDLVGKEVEIYTEQIQALTAMQILAGFGQAFAGKNAEKKSLCVLYDEMKKQQAEKKMTPPKKEGASSSVKENLAPPEEPVQWRLVEHKDEMSDKLEYFVEGHSDDDGVIVFRSCTKKHPFWAADLEGAYVSVKFGDRHKKGLPVKGVVRFDDIPSQEVTLTTIGYISSLGEIDTVAFPKTLDLRKEFEGRGIMRLKVGEKIFRFSLKGANEVLDESVKKCEARTEAQK